MQESRLELFLLGVADVLLDHRVVEIGSEFMIGLLQLLHILQAEVGI